MCSGIPVSGGDCCAAAFDAARDDKNAKIANVKKRFFMTLPVVLISAITANRQL